MTGYIEITSSATLEQVLLNRIPFVNNECADPFQFMGGHENKTPCAHTPAWSVLFPNAWWIDVEDDLEYERRQRG